MDFNSNNKGAGIIQPLLIAATIVLIIAALLYYFDPIRKFKSARDAERWEDTSLILKSLKKYYSANKKANLFKEIDGLYRGDWYMIVGGNKLKGCDDSNKFSDVEIFDDDYCLDLSVLSEEGYVGELPVSPEGDIKWDKGIENSNKGTGYAFMIDDDDIIHIKACESENTTEIIVSGKVW